MASLPLSLSGTTRSLAGRQWRWRGGNMDLGTMGDGFESADSSAGGTLTDDLVTQLLLARGVARDGL